MKLISFDVGIKNMAYCIFDCSQQVCIDSWDILNLMETEKITITCGCKDIPKSKKAAIKQCTKPAKYYKNVSNESVNYYCEKHAKKNGQYLIPTKQTSLPFLKKQKIDVLLKIGQSLNLLENQEKQKRAEIVDIINAFYEKQCFDTIVMKKSKTANDTDLVFIGKKMKELLNQIPNIQDITDVAIENQISPIANRMKTIQGMLAQYFIMNNSDTNIQFISSSHKLKQFENKEKEKEKEKKDDNENKNNIQLENILTPAKEIYTKHKKDGIYHCSQMIDNNPIFETWKGSLLTKKKDDLADCFLQGIWYLRNKKIITFADDLNIKLVGLS